MCHLPNTQKANLNTFSFGGKKASIFDAALYYKFLLFYLAEVFIVFQERHEFISAMLGY